MTTERQGFFSDKDRKILDAVSKSTWVPEEPAELILPYIEKDDIEGESELDKRRRKSHEVYDGYISLEAQCKQIREDIAKRCQTVSVKIDPDKNFEVLQAARRLFRRDVKEINFEKIKEEYEKLGVIF